MKILFDYQVFNWQKKGGISRFISEIIANLKVQKSNKIALSVINSVNIHYKTNMLYKSSIRKYALYFYFLFKHGKRALGRFNYFYSVALLESQKFDVFVPTYYDNYFLQYIGDKPFVVIVHDMIHEIFPEILVNSKQLIEQKKNLIYKSKKIIAVSISTKKDILKFYPDIDPQKIDIVHLGFSVTQKEILPNIKLPKDYILFVGERGAYKNFHFFIMSLYKLLLEDNKLHILCIGGETFSDEELHLFKQLNILDKIQQYYAKDEELYTIYHKAKVFVFPSRYEGFGIPILEAMASDCPVVLSQSSSFPEVAGDAGVYFKLDDEADLYIKVKEMLDNEDHRSFYIKKGRENITRFSWLNTATNCLNVFNEAQN